MASTYRLKGKFLFDVSNAKIGKGLRPRRGDGERYLIGVFYMAPADMASPPGKTVCPQAGACKAACLAYSGKGGFDENVKQARINRTKAWYGGQREELIEQLAWSIEALKRGARKWAPHPTKTLRDRGAVPFSGEYVPVVRLNGTSDLPWESMGLMERFPEVRFYDYTKNATRMMAFLNNKMPRNYHLTFSMGGTQDERIPEILRAGGNVTVVFDDHKPKRWGGEVLTVSPRGEKRVVIPESPCIDGDVDDLRILDAWEKQRRGIPKSQGCIIALKFKRITDTARAAKMRTIQAGSAPQFTHEAGGFSPMPEFDSEALRRSVARSNPDDALEWRFGCGGFGVTVAKD